MGWLRQRGEPGERTALPVERAIPSLDGLRAFAVVAVLLQHSLQLPHYVPGLHNGDQGVAVFFVLSGFLITHLLLKERNRTGEIDLVQFYFRRTLRIFPPFLVFLGVVAAMGVLHVVPVTRGAWVAAATYTLNYVRVPEVWPENWVLLHSWSLSLEEQFYLLWPLCVRWMPKRACVGLCVGVIALSPVSRVVTYAMWPAMRGHLDKMLHTRLDTVMTGSLLALLVDLEMWIRVRRWALRWWAPAMALVFLLLIDVPLWDRWRGAYRLLVGISVENVMIAVLLLYVVGRHHSPLGRMLNWGPVRHVGRISYSLYLWQQLFTGPLTRWFPLNLAMVWVVAEGSYWLVERPSFRVRDWLGRRWFGTD